MTIFNKKNITLFLFIASWVPTIEANNTKPKDEKEVPTTFYKIYFNYKHKGQGALGFKYQNPLDRDTIFYCDFALDCIGSFNPIYKITTSTNSTETTTIFDNIDSDPEKTVDQAKKVAKELYFQQTDDTGEQARKIGIFKNPYDGMQMIGLSLKTPIIKLAIDVEGMARKLADQDSDSSNEDSAYKKNPSGFGALTMTWKDVSDSILEASFGLKIAKGDFENFGKNNSSPFFKYFEGMYIKIKPNEPILGIFRDVKLKYTNLKTARNKKKPDEPLGELCVIPGVSLDLECEDIEIFDEEAKVFLSLSYNFCDIKKQTYKKPDNGSNNQIGDPVHYTMSLNLAFKDIFGQKGLSFSPKMTVSWAHSYESGWNIDKYIPFSWGILFTLQNEIILDEYYSP